MQTKTKNVKFDMERAKDIADAFTFTSGVRCVIYSDMGEAVYEQKEKFSDCSFCRKLCENTGVHFHCEKLHPYSIQQSDRFAGRYIYSCPAGMAFSVSPIRTDGKVSGALICGPVMITDEDEFLENTALGIETLPRRIVNEIKIILDCVPQLAPKRMSYIANQLFANAVYISDSGREVTAARQDDDLQNYIGNYILQLDENDASRSYPTDKENELFNAVARADKDTANTLLNDLLGHIYFYTGDPDEIRDRIVELFTILSRAAIYGGANTDRILKASHQYMQEMRSVADPGELTRWLAASLNRFIGNVFNMLDVKHNNVMYGAVDYISSNYAKHLTLDDVSEYVGYSPAYFSTIFKEEMGKSFKEYLNEVRIEKSKAILLSSTTPVSQVCTLVGFNDQSYFCKTFKQQTGVSPDKFRKRVRRIDAEREMGRK